MNERIRGEDVVSVTERETELYIKSDVDKVIAEKDAVIAELKAKLEGAKNETNYWCNNLKVFAQKKDAEIAELKAQKASHYAEMVDAGMRERRLNCALWLARGYIMTLLQRDFQRLAYQTNNDNYKKDLLRSRNRFYDLYEKCIKKAEQYK